MFGSPMHFEIEHIVLAVGAGVEVAIVNQQFVLKRFGLCADLAVRCDNDAGADQAVRTAIEDERVVGAALVDGYTYSTKVQVLHHYVDRFWRPRSWWNVLSLQHPAYARLLSRFRRAPVSAPVAAPVTRQADGLRLGVYVRPRRDVAEQLLGRLANRGCELFLAYTPSARFNRRAQFGEMYPSMAHSEQVRLEYFEHSNHLFTLLASQEALSDRVEAWMTDVVLPRSGSQPRQTGP